VPVSVDLMFRLKKKKKLCSFLLFHKNELKTYLTAILPVVDTD